MATSDFINDLVEKISEKTVEYEELAQESLQELLGIANDKLWNTMGSIHANTDKAREISLGALSDLPSDRPKVNVPAFVFNPQDYLTTDLLQQYTYTSDFFTYLDPNLRTFIETETAFIDQTVQDALFQQTYNRDLQTLNDALDAANRTQARRGFPIPNSMLLAAQADIIKKYQDVKADRNKEVTALIAERAHDGRKHSIESGIRMEDIRSRFQLEYGRLYFQVAEYLVRKYQADVQAEVARVSAELDQLKVKSTIDLGMVSSDNTWTGLQMENLRTQMTRIIEDAKAELDVQKTEAQMQMSALTKMIEFYTATHSAYVGQVTGISLDSGTADS